MEETTITAEDLKIVLPCRILFCGPSGVGKSGLIRTFLLNANQMFSKKFDEIMYCHPESILDSHKAYINSLREFIPNLIVNSGLPDFDQFTLHEGQKLIILDDLMLSIVNDKGTSEAFTVLSSHGDMSIFLCAQNIFTQGRYSKTILRNRPCDFLFIYS